MGGEANGPLAGQPSIGTQCGYYLKRKNKMILHSKSENGKEKLGKAPQWTWNWKRS